MDTIISLFNVQTEFPTFLLTLVYVLISFLFSSLTVGAVLTIGIVSFYTVEPL